MFYADDSMIFAKTREDAEKNLQEIAKISAEYGLHINMEKSKILVYGAKEEYGNIGGIEVVEKVKYLGLMVDNKRDIYKTQKEEIEKRTKTYENLTYSVVTKCCNRILIGKNYWKGIVLPTVLHGAGLMNPGGALINKLQRMENGVYRKILGARRNTVVEVLRGEVGASATETRFIESRLMLTKSMWEGKNEWVKEILKKVRENGRNNWNRVLNGYLKKIGISFEELIEMGKEEVKRKVRDYDSKKWKEGLEKKTSVKIYKKYKKEIKEDRIYNNKMSSKILFQARANCMGINNRFRHVEGKETRCDLCGNCVEDLGHFLIECESLKDKRNIEIMNRNKSENKDEWMGRILWEEKDIEGVKEMLGEMWKGREEGRKRLGL